MTKVWTALTTRYTGIKYPLALNIQYNFLLKFPPCSQKEFKLFELTVINSFIYLWCVHWTAAYQSDKEKQDLKAPTQGSNAVDVPVAHRGHGHHQEVNTVPVGQRLSVSEVRRISRIFKLKCIISWQGIYLIKELLHWGSWRPLNE